MPKGADDNVKYEVRAVPVTDGALDVEVSEGFDFMAAQMKPDGQWSVLFVRRTPRYDPFGDMMAVAEASNEDHFFGGFATMPESEVHTHDDDDVEEDEDIPLA